MGKNRMRTQKLKTDTSPSTSYIYDQFVETARRQFGKLIYYMSLIESSAEDVVDKLIVPEIPKRLRPNDFRFAGMLIHGYEYLE